MSEPVIEPPSEPVPNVQEAAASGTDYGPCQRCPTVGRVGPWRNRRDRRKHSYCKQCRAEYARNRGKAQTRAKGALPSILGLIDHLDQFLFLGDVTSAKVMSANIRDRVMRLVPEVSVPTLVTRSEIPPPSLEELETKYWELEGNTEQDVLYKYIKGIYPDWDSAAFRARMREDDDWLPSEEEIRRLLGK